MQWSSGSNKEWYMYDASGQRVLRRSQTSTGTTVTVYAFGLEEHSYSFDSNGTLSGQSQTYYYSLGGGLLGALEVNGSSSSTDYFLTDTLGSVLATINNTVNSASVQGNQLYDPYGNNRYQSGSMNTSKGFTGQYTDNLSGLDYYGSRYYDPAAGVFLSADPMQGDRAGTNPYEYVGSNPETNTDPTGQMYAPPPPGGGSPPPPPPWFGGGSGTGGGGSTGTGNMPPSSCGDPVQSGCLMGQLAAQLNWRGQVQVSVHIGISTRGGLFCTAGSMSQVIGPSIGGFESRSRLLFLW